MKQLLFAALALVLAVQTPALAEALHSIPERERAAAAIEIAGLRTLPKSALADRRARHLPLVHAVTPQRLPLSLVDAVIINESGYRTDVRGRHGEVGLMQILPATARGIARQVGLSGVAGMSNGELVKFLSKPRNNLRLGLAYLEWCHKRAKSDIGATIGCYNAGPGNMWRWNRIAITRNYVRKVRQHMAAGSAGS